MADNNGILKRIDDALESPETPGYMVPVLLCIRDDHVRLGEHLDWHSRLNGEAGKILVGVLSALALMLVVWLLSARFPWVR